MFRRWTSTASRGVAQAPPYRPSRASTDASAGQQEAEHLSGAPPVVQSRSSSISSGSPGWRVAKDPYRARLSTRSGRSPAEHREGPPSDIPTRFARPNRPHPSPRGRRRCARPGSRTRGRGQRPVPRLSNASTRPICPSPFQQAAYAGPPSTGRGARRILARRRCRPVPPPNSVTAMSTSPARCVADVVRSPIMVVIAPPAGSTCSDLATLTPPPGAERALDGGGSGDGRIDVRASDRARCRGPQGRRAPRSSWSPRTTRRRRATVDAAGVDMILVGDSLAMVVLGYDDTLQVTTDDMAHHVGAVARTKPHALVVADLPWLSYHVSREETVRNAAALDPRRRGRGEARRRPQAASTRCRRSSTPRSR